MSAIAVLAGTLARAPRRRRLRLRRLAVRDRAARAHATSARGRRRAATCRRAGRNSAHPSIVPFQNFATADGWIVVACPKEKFWAAALRGDRAARAGRRSSRASPTATARRDELVPILEDVFRERTSEEWLEVLAAAGVPCGAGQRRARRRSSEARLVEYEHPQLGTVRQVASPLRLSGRGAAACGRAPARGEHTEQVLVELCGYEPARVRELAAAGVFGARRKEMQDA